MAKEEEKPGEKTVMGSSEQIEWTRGGLHTIIKPTKQNNHLQNNFTPSVLCMYRFPFSYRVYLQALQGTVVVAKALSALG